MADVNFEDYGLQPVSTNVNVDYGAFGLMPAGNAVAPQNSVNRVQAGLNKDPFSFLSKLPKDIAAGLLNSVVQTGKMLPNVGFYGKNEERPTDKIDAYKTFGVENKPFYTPEGAVQTVGELLPSGSGIVGLSKLGLKGLKGGFNIAKGAFQNLEPYEQAAEKAAQESKLAEEGKQRAIEEIRGQTGKSNEGRLRYAKMQAEQELANTPMSRPSNLPVLSSDESAQHLAGAGLQQENAAKNVENIENNISEHLNAGTDHDVHAAAQILKAQDKIRTGLSEKYDELTHEFKQNNVLVDNSNETKSLTTRLLELVKQGQMDSPVAKKVATELADLKNAKTIIPADEYLTVLRSAKDYARQARTKAFTPGMNAEERAEWHRRYNALDDTVQEMEGNLENAVGDVNAEKLKDTNSAWRDYVIPLQKNTTFQTIRHKGRIEGDIMNKLRGTDKGDVLMRNIIKSDPEILKNVVGKRYAEKPTELHEAGERENEYISKMPQLKNMLQQHKEATTAHENANQNLSTIEKYHENVLKQEKKGQELAAKEQEKFKQTQVRKQELKDEIDNLDANINKITARSKHADITLDEKMRLEAQLKKLKAKRKANRTILAGSAFAVGVPTIARWPAKAIINEIEEPESEQGEQA